MKQFKNKSSHQTPQAFTLVELMVVVAILAIMGASVVVGFGRAGGRIVTGQAANVVDDIVRRMELEVLMGWVEKSSIQFYPHYLVVVSQLEDQTYSLEWEGLGQGNCNENEGGMRWANDGDLIKNNMNMALSAQTVNVDGQECVDFRAAPDRMWRYQLRGNHGRDYSAIIRLYHFDLNRDQPSDLLISDNDYRLEISGPYGKKDLYQNGLPVADSRSIDLQHPDGFIETITLLN